MTKFGVSEAVQNCLKTAGVLDSDSLQILASTEAEVKSEIVDMINGTVEASAPKLIADMAQKIAIKKLWRACKDTYKAQEKAVASAEAVVAPIPNEQREDIKELWSSTHGFVLPEDWLLVESLQGKLWRGCGANPARIDTVLVQGLRTMSCSSQITGTQLSLVPGKAVETQAVMVDAVSKPIELYMRCRAWFCTMAYVSVRKRSWFDYQTALFGSDKILAFVSQTFDGQHAPTSFYASAWAATIHFFAEQVRLNGVTLKEAVKNTGQWEHRWTNFVLTKENDSSKGHGVSRSSVPDLPKDVQNEMKKLETSVRQWQSSSDYYKRKYEESERSTGGKGGNGKNGKKGVDKRKAEDNRRDIGHDRRDGRPGGDDRAIRRRR